jgi:hypothetical protein
MHRRPTKDYLNVYRDKLGPSLCVIRRVTVAKAAGATSR